MIKKKIHLKSFLLLIYTIAGLLISLFTAVMTYLIIGEPIGAKMTSKIALTIFVTLPVIGIISYFIGNYLAQKFSLISQRLDAIHKQEFLQNTYHDNIIDIHNIHDDITYLSKELEMTINKLQQHNNNLSTIVKSLSHDIKTPLTIIDGYLEECEDQMISAQQMPHVITILKKETAYLNELSSEAITYIQSQEITLKQETFNLKDFLHDEVCPLLKVKPDVTLSCKINKEQLFTFNPTALKKILINLLHNASKYTNKGSITIVANDDTIMIEDSGEGIDVLDAEKIFTPFLTLDESKNRQKSGFGLGLSIARNLAEKNNFTLYLDRDYHKGCRFILKKQ